MDLANWVYIHCVLILIVFRILLCDTANSIPTILWDEHSDYLTIIKNQPRTTFGTWGAWEYCDEGKFATGFRLQTQADQGSGKNQDDSALNAIKLYCNAMGEKRHENFITSKEGVLGEYGRIYDCENGLISGFNLRTEEDQGVPTFFSGPRDDTAANNVIFYCTGTNTKEYEVGIEGDGLSNGEYDLKEKRCVDGHAICGIRTEVEDDSGTDGDSTALNNVEFKCCKVPNSEEMCAAEDKWVLVAKCGREKVGSEPIGALNPTQKDGPFKCGYNVRKGITTLNTNSMTKSDQISHAFGAGFDGDTKWGPLQTKFTSPMINNQLSKEDWISSTSDIFAEETEFRAEFTVPQHSVTELQQLIGVCGPYTIQTKTYKFITTLSQIE